MSINYRFSSQPKAASVSSSKAYSGHSPVKGQSEAKSGKGLVNSAMSRVNRKMPQLEHSFQNRGADKMARMRARNTPENSAGKSVY